MYENAYRLCNHYLLIMMQLTHGGFSASTTDPCFLIGVRLGWEPKRFFDYI